MDIIASIFSVCSFYLCISDILSQNSALVGNYSVQCVLFSNIPSSHPLDGSSNFCKLQQMTKSLKVPEYSLGGKNHLQLIMATLIAFVS